MYQWQLELQSNYKHFSVGYHTHMQWVGYTLASPMAYIPRVPKQNGPSTHLDIVRRYLVKDLLTTSLGLCLLGQELITSETPSWSSNGLSVDNSINQTVNYSSWHVGWQCPQARSTCSIKFWAHHTHTYVWAMLQPAQYRISYQSSVGHTLQTASALDTVGDQTCSVLWR